ncbi:hypothetical protein GCM10027049_11130 [Mucilaginibacter puniceus]
MQQSALVQVVFAHVCPLGQLVQVACFDFAFLTGAVTFAITEVAANAIASMLNIIFFIFDFFKKLNNISIERFRLSGDYLTGFRRFPVSFMVIG